MKTDYSPFVHVSEDGNIWWRLDDAIKLGAGYLPIRDDERNLIPVLRAQNNRVRANERTLISEFSPAHYTEAHPRLLVRDDGRYVEAHEFLKWLYEHITQRQSAIRFPDELARAVRGAARSPNKQTSFESLTTALEGYFDKSIDNLPDKQRHRVEMDFPLTWDELSPEERRIVVAQWDKQSDPTYEERHAVDWGAVSVDWDYWQRVPSLTAQEFCILRYTYDPRKFEDERTYILGGIGKPFGERVSDDVRIIERSLGPDTNKPIKEWILWAQQQCWDIPAYLRALVGGDCTISPLQVDQVDPADSGDPCAVFRTMVNLTAEQVSITFVGDRTESGTGANNKLKISARNKTKYVALVALDLVSQRREGGLNHQGAILLGMAQKKKLTRTNSIAMKITRLRKIFHEHLGISGDPFDPYRKGVGWEPRFKIADDRGATDERAKQEAEQRTVSYEGLLETGTQFGDTNQTHQFPDLENDTAEEWLKNNDPNVSA